MKKIQLLIVILSLCFGAIAQTGTIANIKVTQRTDFSGMFDIYFDLTGQSKTYNVSVEVIFDGDANYVPISKTFLTGDIAQIAPGLKKHIIWDGNASFPDKYSKNTTLKIVASSIADWSGVTGTFVDARDGHQYKWVKIGSQIWMAENLAYLPSVSPPSDGSLSAPFYYVFENSGTDVSVAKATANYQTYGVLYNSPSAKLASPAGWHLPSDDEWKQMEITLGLTQAQANSTGQRGTDQGAKMKNTTGWTSSGNGNNSSGFSALPYGIRFGDHDIWGPAGWSNWWTSTGLYFRRLDDNNSFVSRYASAFADDGLSVRCVKDSETSPIPTNGLVAYWPFNGNANDESGNGHNGTLNGATPSTNRTGMTAKALHFDGNTSYVQVPYSASLLPGSGSYSFSGWFKLTNAPVNKATYFFAIDDGTSDYSGVQAFYDQVTQQLMFMYHYDDLWSHHTYIKAYFDLNIWHHVLSTYDKPNLQGNLYIDGVLMATSTLDNNNVTAKTDLFFGRRSFVAGTDVFFQGDQDDIRIYNRVLSDQEIRALFME